ncbi:MAG: flippase [Candidatus Aenigmarchaeota archaeon]|nr:flippase [Candidatus Aenigmarchaeota archaeon]
MTNYVDRIAKGTVIVFAMLILSGFVGYLLRMFLARNLSVAEYGLFYAVFMFISLFGLFRDIGLNQAIVKFIPEFLVKKEFSRIKSSIVISVLIQSSLSLVIISVLLYFSNALALSFFKNPAATGIVATLLIFFLVQLFFQLFKFTFQGFQSMKLFAFSEFLYILFVFLSVIILFALFGPSPINVAYGYLIGTSIVSAICFLSLVKIFPRFFGEKIQIDKNLTKKLFFFALPVLIAGIANLIIGYTDTICLTFFRSLEEVGLYQVAMPTAQVMMYFASALISVLFPVISELWTMKNYSFISEGLSLLLKFSFILILPAGLIFFSFPEIVINLLFGSSYLGAVHPLQILSVGFLFFTLGVILTTTLNGIGKPVINTKIVFFAAIFNLIANIILVPIYGTVGAAMTTLVSYLIYLLLSDYFLNKEFGRIGIKFKIPYLPLMRTFLGGLITLAIIFVLKNILIIANPWLEMTVVLIFSFSFYLLWIFYAKCLTIDDLKILGKINVPIPDWVIDFVKKMIR